MTTDQLRSKLEREPFRPFIVELGSGRQILIDRSDDLVLPRRRPDLVIAFTADGLMHEFEAGVIASIIEP